MNSVPSSPVPASAAIWGTVDTPESLSDDRLATVASTMMSTHAALRAVITDTTAQFPESPLVTAHDIIAEGRSGPGILASAFAPSDGLVWQLSRLSPTRLLVCVHRGVVDAASWSTVIGDVADLVHGKSLDPAGSWQDAAAALPTETPAPIDGGGPATYKTFDVSDAEALLTLLPDQLGTGVEEILAASVVIARAASGRPIDSVALRARGATGDQWARTVGRLDRQFTAAVPHIPATEDDLLTGAPVVRDVVDATASLLDESVDTGSGKGTVSRSDELSPDATVEVSRAKISVTGPVRPVDGVAHVILGTQRLERVSVVDERGGSHGVLLWRWLEQALISLSALARLTDAGVAVTGPDSGTAPVPARSHNLFGPAAQETAADRTVDLRHLPEVNGFAVAKRLADNHSGGTTLVLLPGVTDPKATGGRSGRVGSGVTARLITPR